MSKFVENPFASRSKTLKKILIVGKDIILPASLKEAYATKGHLIIGDGINSITKKTLAEEIKKHGYIGLGTLIFIWLKDSIIHSSSHTESISFPDAPIKELLEELTALSPILIERKAREKTPLQIHLFSCANRVAPENIMALPKDSVLIMHKLSDKEVNQENYLHIIEMLSHNATGRVLKDIFNNAIYEMHSPSIVIKQNDNNIKVLTLYFPDRILIKAKDIAQYINKQWRSEIESVFGKDQALLPPTFRIEDIPSYEEILQLVNNNIEAYYKKVVWAKFFNASTIEEYENCILYLSAIGKKLDDPLYAGQTLLMLACKSDNIKLAKSLLQAGANPCKIDERGNTSLHFVSSSEMLKLFFEGVVGYEGSRSGEVSTSSTFLSYMGITWLGMALSQVITRNAISVINAINKNGSIPLHMAAERGLTEVVKELLKHKAQINKTDYDGNTPLMLATLHGNISTVEILLTNGANANKGNYEQVSPVEAAILNGYTEIVNLLAENGADINIKNKKGWAPIHSAAFHGKVDILKKLLDKGVSAIEFTEDRSATPMHLAAQNGHVGVISFLLDNGVSVHSKNNKEATSLHFAAATGHTEAVLLLLNKGADINDKSNGGLTPLHLAAFYGKIDVVKILLTRGAFLTECTTDGSTPIHLAAQNGHAATVSVLLKENETINAKNKKGDTPLKLAIENRRIEVVKQLLDAGATTEENVELAEKIYALSQSYTNCYIYKGRTIIGLAIIAEGSEESDDLEFDC